MKQEQEEETDTITLIPFRYDISFLQELDGIVLAESFEDAREDIQERGEKLPQFTINKLAEISKEEYLQTLQEYGMAVQKEQLN